MGTILCDNQIRALAYDEKMIEPFEPKQVTYVSKQYENQKVISFGTSGYGYDMRVGRDFKIFRPVYGKTNIVDPKNFDMSLLAEYTGDFCIIPPNSFALASSLEYFKIPRNILALVLGKSTYARCGIVTNFTPLEPEWEGFVTIEISNTGNLPAIIYANEGIAQVIFFTADQVCETSYRDKGGKYNKQTTIQTARV